jgi:hypothetical protein
MQFSLPDREAISSWMTAHPPWLSIGETKSG